jgi:hypothetical protein
MDDTKKKRKRTKKELKALAEKNSISGKMHVQPQPTIEPSGSSGTDELIKRDYGFDWFGNKGLHPDLYWPEG